MSEKFDYYGRLKDALYRFACGPWPPAGQAFQWRTGKEVDRALRWIDQLEREQGREEIEERAGRYQRRMAKKRAAREKVAAVVKLVPPAS